MGRDKAAVKIGVHRSIDQVVARLSAVLPTVIVVGGSDMQAIDDLEPGGGPVQAIAAAAAQFPGRAMLVVACDMPWLTPATVQHLSAPLGDAIARIPRVEGRKQPLCAHYGAGALACFETAWRDGVRAMYRVVATLDAIAWLEVSDAVGAGVVDFDTPEEFAALSKQFSS
ncbi:MAG: molybdopterin-guanine dinucleotide biosynthesis protein A [Myxococcota bacterium]|jgi:molybdopterin-guanine dinucleotide biosynthesis protein A